MTTLISWVSYHGNGLAAAYMASDSRITWRSSGHSRWDAGRKIFASRKHPDVLGYTGDVVFPALVLGQIIEALDAGSLCDKNADPWQRHQTIKEAVQESFARRHKAENYDFTILHLSRSGEKKDASVHAWQLEYSAPTDAWTDQTLRAPDATSVIARLGSGASIAAVHQRKWNEQDAFSREIFSSFCDAISSSSDPLSGGAPQLAGFYPRGPALNFGVFHKGVAFLHGLPLVAPKAAAELEWRDDLFQRVDCSGSRLPGAQPHARTRKG